MKDKPLTMPFIMESERCIESYSNLFTYAEDGCKECMARLERLLAESVIASILRFDRLEDGVLHCTLTAQLPLEYRVTCTFENPECQCGIHRSRCEYHK